MLAFLFSLYSEKCAKYYRFDKIYTYISIYLTIDLSISISYSICIQSIDHSNFLTLVSLLLGLSFGGKVLQFSSGVGSLSMIARTFFSNSGVHFRATSRQPKFSSNYFTFVAPRRHVLVSVLTIAHAIANCA